MKNKIKSVVIEFSNGTEVPVTKHLNMPFTWESALDETHGTAKMVLTEMRQQTFDKYNVRIDEALKVNTPIEITFDGQETVIRMIIAKDTAEMVRKDNFATWSHTLELVDETKRLELEPVDNLTFTNPIPRGLFSDNVIVWNTEISASNGLPDSPENSWVPGTFKQIQVVGSTISFNDNLNLFSYNENTAIVSFNLKIVAPNGAVQEEISPLSISNNAYTNTEYAIRLNQIGTHSIVISLSYLWKKTQSGTISSITITKTATFTVAEADDAPTPYTIKDVIDRILSVTPTRTKNGENKYTFYNDAAEYATEESPEFSFTGKHLFEVMLDIASYKKMFPALHKNEVYFRPFNTGVYWSEDELPVCTKAIQCSTIDQHCNNLDSYVENLVCLNDTRVGTVVEPYASGYITPRAKEGFEISETTAMVPTQSGIYQSVKLEMGEVVGKLVGDIEKYIYESEDYDSLGNRDASYPYNKAYALKYIRQAKNYTELGHRIILDNDIEALLARPSIANIVEDMAGESVGETLWTWIGADKSAPFADLLFRPTYIPSVNARVRQYKPMFSFEEENATLFYNQQSDLVDSEAFGEHLKGFIQKLGNHTEIRVYTFGRIDDVPKVGDLVGEKSVYNVAMTIYEDHVDVTLCLVDYAELSKYIGVKNQIKTSDISISKWSQRYINWEEFFVFTHNEDYIGTALSVTPEAMKGLIDFTNQKASPLTCAMITNYTEKGNVINEIFAPIKHLAIGNSIYFQFEMLDNFAAGYQSEEAPLGATSALTGTKYNRAQCAVRYCDSYGRTETVDFKLLKDGPNYENSTYALPSTVNSYIKDNDGIYIVFYEAVEVYQYIQVILATETTDAGTVEWVENTIAEPGVNQVKIPIVLNFGGTISSKNTKIVAIVSQVCLDEEKHKGQYMRSLAYAYPEKPSWLKLKEGMNSPVFKIYDLLVKKNSSEALKYAAQYHFRQEHKNFVLGSGMSNFCSLVGGSCQALHLFIANVPINRFERHIKLDDTSKYIVLDALPTFAVNENKERIEITLPASVNGYYETLGKTSEEYKKTCRSWGLVGMDRYGNYQLIFGENRDGVNEFDEMLYLVPIAKINELKQKATYTLTCESSNASHSLYVDGLLVVFENNATEIPRNAVVTVENTHIRSFKFTLDGVTQSIGAGRSITFTMSKDMTYKVYDGYNGPVIM